jgi:hypothetical protein
MLPGLRRGPWGRRPLISQPHGALLFALSQLMAILKLIGYSAYRNSSTVLGVLHERKRRGLQPI